MVSLGSLQEQIANFLARATSNKADWVFRTVFDVRETTYEEKRRHPEYTACAVVIGEIQGKHGELFICVRNVTFDGTMRGFVTRFGEVLLRHYSGGFKFSTKELNAFGWLTSDLQKRIDTGLRDQYNAMIALYAQKTEQNEPSEPQDPLGTAIAALRALKCGKSAFTF